MRGRSNQKADRKVISAIILSGPVSRLMGERFEKAIRRVTETVRKSSAADRQKHEDAFDFMNRNHIITIRFGMVTGFCRFVNNEWRFTIRNMRWMSGRSYLNRSGKLFTANLTAAESGILAGPSLLTTAHQDWVSQS